jgi:dienelactone hydrolase
LRDRVFGNFRRFMWPILGQSTLDALRIVDWAVETLDVAPEIYMGGFSLGGDIAVAAAGIDPRIRRVAAMIATPDWLRPGMHIGTHPPALMDQGAPDSYARFFYERLNPLTHPTAYAHQPAITFELGADDRHVPPDGALRFEAVLRALYPSYGDALRVTLQDGTAHEVTPLMWQRCLEWWQR